MKIILIMYISLIPMLIAGVLTSLWCSLPILNFLKVPMDFNKKYIDDKRIFGDHKTWKGFIGYIITNMLCAPLWGIICNLCNLNNLNFFYINHINTFSYNILIGVLLGIAYALFELPNSFLKRRLDIKEGKNTTGFKKIFFIFLDQADSLFGCCLVVCLFYNLGILYYILYVLIGALTHIIVNMLLYLFGLRENMF